MIFQNAAADVHPQDSPCVRASIHRPNKGTLYRKIAERDSLIWISLCLPCLSIPMIHGVQINHPRISRVIPCDAFVLKREKLFGEGPIRRFSVRDMPDMIVVNIKIIQNPDRS
ncbi:MAG: hypothetical protein WBM17_04930, partial [Anaerolineales bacterium]